MSVFLGSSCKLSAGGKSNGKGKGKGKGRGKVGFTTLQPVRLHHQTFLACMQAKMIPFTSETF
eukprot:6245538-Amphidinium_carterae.1